MLSLFKKYRHKGKGHVKKEVGKTHCGIDSEKLKTPTSRSLFKQQLNLCG